MRLTPKNISTTEKNVIVEFAEPIEVGGKMWTKASCFRTAYEGGVDPMAEALLGASPGSSFDLRLLPSKDGKYLNVKEAAVVSGPPSNGQVKSSFAELREQGMREGCLLNNATATVNALVASGALAPGPAGEETEAETWAAFLARVGETQNALFALYARAQVQAEAPAEPSEDGATK